MCSSRAAAVFVVVLAAASSIAATTDRAPKSPDAALVDARVQKTVQWFHKSLRSGYERKNDKWDAAALEALDATADLWSHNPARAGGEQERAWRSSQKATAAGCDDPLVLFIHACSYEAVALESWDDTVRFYLDAASGLDDSKASAALKASAHLRAASAMINKAIAAKSTSVKGIPAQLEAAKGQLAGVAKEGDVPDAFVLRIVARYLDTARLIGKDRQEEFDAIAPLFTKGALVPLLRAQFLIDYGWDARSGRVAAALTDNAVSVFDSRIADADLQIAKALAIDPLSPSIAPLMLVVELAQGKGVARMESWFRYGVAVDPGNEELYLAKLHYLEPRWHGTTEAMIEFGRAALATKQWALRTPLILINAYDDGAPTCAEVKSVYDPYLQLYPDSNYDRSQYARLLYECGYNDEENRKFKTLGNDGRLGPFGTRANYENKRLDSAARAKPVRR